MALIECSCRLALLALVYAVAALLVGGLLASTPEEILLWWPLPIGGWRAFLTPLGVLLLPAAVLVTVRLVALAAQRKAAPS